MKDIKQIEVGDYVICEEINVKYLGLKKFLENNIGVIISYTDSCSSYSVMSSYNVNYSDIPDDIKNYFNPYFNSYCRRMFINEFKYWSKNIEDLKIMIEASKYNL